MGRGPESARRLVAAFRLFAYAAVAATLQAWTVAVDQWGAVSHEDPRAEFGHPFAFLAFDVPPLGPQVSGGYHFESDVAPVEVLPVPLVLSFGFWFALVALAARVLRAAPRRRRLAAAVLAVGAFVVCIPIILAAAVAGGGGGEFGPALLALGLAVVFAVAAARVRLGGGRWWRRTAVLAALSACALFAVVMTAAFPVDARSAAHLRNVEFGKPFAFVHADLSRWTPPAYPERMTWNPWEDQAAIDGSSFLASYAVVLALFLAFGAAFAGVARSRTARSAGPSG